MTGPSSAAGRYSKRPVGLQGSSSSQPVLQMPQTEEPILGLKGAIWERTPLETDGTMTESCSLCERPHEAGIARQATEAGVTCRSSSGPSQLS